MSAGRHHFRRRAAILDQQEYGIKGIRYFGIALSTTSLMAVGACSNMSRQDKATAIGAGVGAVGGAALTGGGALGTVGGAAVGGVIGNQVGKDKDKK